MCRNVSFCNNRKLDTLAGCMWQGRTVGSGARWAEEGGCRTCACTAGVAACARAPCPCDLTDNTTAAVTLARTLPLTFLHHIIYTGDVLCSAAVERGARRVLPALRRAVPLPTPGDAPRHLSQRRALAVPVPDLRMPR